MNQSLDPRKWLPTPALFACILLASCGGGADPSSEVAPPVPTPPATPATSFFETASLSARVVVPSGMTVRPETLTVSTSATQATPSASGEVTITAYTGGTQLAIVTTAAGYPFLMGWIDATHHTIDVATTAQVYGYFALGSAYMFDQVDRDAMIAGLPQEPGIAALASVIERELRINPEGFKQRNVVLKQAVADFAAQVLRDARAAPAATRRVHAQAVAILGDKASGINVLEDPPFAAHLTNSFRRRAHAFVQRVSHTTNGVEVADPFDATDFEVPPTIGFSGGVTGVVSDMVNNYYGNQETAYADISAPDGGISLPLVDGSDKTTYRLTVVGAGLSAGAEGALTAAQKIKQQEIMARGFVMDFLLPTMGNAAFGSGFLDFKDGLNTEKGKFLGEIATAMAADIALAQGQIGGIQDKIRNGKWQDAASDTLTTIAGSNTLSELLKRAFDKAIAFEVAHNGVTEGAMRNYLSHFDSVLDVAGGIFQIFDSVAYLHDMALSDRADQWTVVVSPSRTLLNPQLTVLDVGGTVGLTAKISGLENATGYSYRWTTTGTVGYLNEVSNTNNRTHQKDYCSNGNVALFVREGVKPGNDSVVVKIYSGANCDPAKGYLGGATAKVYASALTITPASTKLKNGETVTMTTTLAGMPPNSSTAIEYRWLTTRDAGELLGSPDGGTNTPVVGTTATYRAHASKVGIDTVTAGVYLGTTLVASARATVAVSSGLSVGTTPFGFVKEYGGSNPTIYVFYSVGTPPTNDWVRCELRDSNGALRGFLYKSDYDLGAPKVDQSRNTDESSIVPYGGGSKAYNLGGGAIAFANTSFFGGSHFSAADVDNRLQEFLRITREEGPVTATFY